MCLSDMFRISQFRNAKNALRNKGISRITPESTIRANKRSVAGLKTNAPPSHSHPECRDRLRRHWTVNAHSLLGWWFGVGGLFQSACITVIHSRILLMVISRLPKQNFQRYYGVQYIVHTRKLRKKVHPQAWFSLSSCLP